MSSEGMHSAPVPQLIMRDKEKPEKSQDRRSWECQKQQLTTLCKQMFLAEEKTYT